MIRLPLLVALLLLPFATASAQSYDPRIAYVVVGGTRVQLYVANADGSRAVQVATAPKGGYINSFDLSPAGNRIAFSDNLALRTVAFSASAGGVSVGPAQTLVSGATASPDFSEDGSRILYTDMNLSAVRVVPTGGGASTFLYDPSPNCLYPRWLRAEDLGNAFVCQRYRFPPGGSAVPELWVVLLDGSDVVTSAGRLSSPAIDQIAVIEDFDVAHTRNTVLVSTAGSVVLEVDILAGTVTDTGACGLRAHYRAGDTHIVHRSPHQASGDYVQSFDVATGVTTRLTKKGDYGWVDARP